MLPQSVSVSKKMPLTCAINSMGRLEINTQRCYFCCPVNPPNPPSNLISIRYTNVFDRSQVTGKVLDARRKGVTTKGVLAILRREDRPMPTQHVAF